MPKVPFRKENAGKEPAGLEANVQESLNVLGQRTLDQANDGKLYRKLLGVNYDHQLTNSGIADSTITAQKILTVSGTSLLPATVPVSALAACNQFAVYRDAAQSCPAGAYTTLFANKVLKDTGSGWSIPNGWYTIPTAGDYWFEWTIGATYTNASRVVEADLVVNSGAVRGTANYSAAGSASVAHGSYLYVNARAGDRIKANFYNGDSGAIPMLVTSGDNHFTGYQVR